MVRLISRQGGGLAALKLTKLFGIDDFPTAKDSGKVLIIITYCYLIITIIITVSITKFLIVTGSPCAYLSRNQRVITWVSKYRCPICTLCNWIPVIVYPRDFHVNYARFFWNV